MKHFSGRPTPLPAEVGVEDRARLERANVLIAGEGILADPLGGYLATAGIGKVGSANLDMGHPLSNIRFGETHRARSNLESEVEPSVDADFRIRSELHKPPMGSIQVQDVLRDYDVVADVTNSVEARYRLNDSCAVAGTPVVHGSIDGFEAHVSVFCEKDGPCYRCLFPGPSTSGSDGQCRSSAAHDLLPGLVAAIQGMEVLKLLLRHGEPLIGRILVIDALGMTFRELRLRRDPACPACGVA